jgi:hypothetical protein
MDSQIQSNQNNNWIKLTTAPLPFKVLITAIIISMNLGMLGAFGQIIVHDIIPTFFKNTNMSHDASNKPMEIDSENTSVDSNRGDLFGDETLEKAELDSTPIYKNEQFIWTLKFTHIHLFGMSIIFIFIGAVALFLDLSNNVRALLIALPFVGIWLDIAAMWLKAFVSPAFFWLHVPAGSLFGIIFVFISLRSLYEMWLQQMAQSRV